MYNRIIDRRTGPCRILSEFFDCDDIEIRYMDLKAKPIEYMSHEVFIEEYTVHHFIAILYYDEGHAYPDEDEIVSSILRYLGTVTEDQHADISFFFSSTGVEDPYVDNDMRYHIDYCNAMIYELKDSKEDIVIFSDLPPEKLDVDHM